MKQRFIVSPSKRPTPENCPKAFLTSDSTAANACVNNDCGYINSATQKLLQNSETTSLEVGAHEDVGEDDDEENYFSDEEIDEQVTCSGEESEPLDEILFRGFYHPHVHIDNHDCLKKTHCFIYQFSVI